MIERERRREIKRRGGKEEREKEREWILNRFIVA